MGTTFCGHESIGDESWAVLSWAPLFPQSGAHESTSDESWAVLS